MATITDRSYNVVGWVALKLTQQKANFLYLYLLHN